MKVLPFLAIPIVLQAGVDKDSAGMNLDVPATEIR